MRKHLVIPIKAELDSPSPDSPSEGRLVFSVDCSANATPEFEGRGGDDLATEISGLLSRAYGHSSVFDLGQLCVLKGSQCWVLYIDILILECGGNLFDAVSMGVKAAMHSTRIPNVKVVHTMCVPRLQAALHPMIFCCHYQVTAVDGGEPEMELSDDPYDGKRLELSNAPVLVTLTRIGNHCIVDPAPEEEACASACVVMGVTPSGRVTAVRKTGAGSFHSETMAEALKMGTVVGREINEALARKLAEEERLGMHRTRYGFLS